jgi:hypothetical protein
MAQAWTTVVTREPEWDDDSRDRVLSLAAHDGEMCPDGCGLPVHESTGPGPFLIDKYVCNATKARERKKRLDEEEATAQAKREGRDKPPEGWNTGVTYYIRESVETPQEDESGD